MIWIRFPMGRLPATGDHHARPPPCLAPFDLHSGGQMHEGRDRTQHSLRMVNKPHQLAQVRLPAKINGPFQLRMVVPELARSEEHTSELQSRLHLVCRLLLEKKKK